MNYYKLNNLICKTTTVVASDNIKEYFKDPEPMTFFELITSTGFIKIMLLLWSPVILLVLLILLIDHLEHEAKMKKRRKKKRV